MLTRREFVRGGVAAFTVSFAAPAFLSDLARAQGALARNLVVLYLSGGNDALSTLVPYTDPQYYAAVRRSRSRRRTCCRSAATRGGNALGLHPRLTGLQDDLQRRPAGDHSAHRLSELEPLAFPGHRHLVARRIPRSPQGTGWLGRYLDTLPSPVDPLSAWSTARETPRTLLARTVGVPSIPSVAGYAFASPNTRRRRRRSRAQRATRIASHLPVGPAAPGVRERDRAGGVRHARSRRARSAPTRRRVTYPNNGFAQALRAVAGAIVQGRRHARCSGCRPAATTRTRSRARTRPTARTRS